VTATGQQVARDLSTDPEKSKRFSDELRSVHPKMALLLPVMPVI